MSNQKSASKSSRIIFKSVGGTYSAIFMSDRGDLYQEYQGTAAAPTKCFPDYSTITGGVVCRLTVSSARSSGNQTPSSIEYSVAGTVLAFNSSGACTTAGFSDLFKLVGGNLVIIGNLVKIASGAGFQITAHAVMPGGEEIYAHMPYSCAPYSEGSAGKLTIAPGDTKNFTIDTEGGSCILKSLLIQDGNETNPDVDWYQFDGSTGTWVSKGTGLKQLTVQESDVDTYALFKAIHSSGLEDTQGVLDSSDPLDILISKKFASSASGTLVATTDEELTDEMDPGAYVLYECTCVTRGSTTPVAGTVTWNPAQLVNAAGLQKLTIQKSGANNNQFKLTVQDMIGAGIGQYEMVFSCTIS